MTSEKSQLKFARSEETGELIGFVSRHSKTRKLMGVREDSRFGKQICVLSEDLKGTLEPNILYSVELKPMHKANGYVVVAATPVLFQAHVETVIKEWQPHALLVGLPLNMDDSESEISRLARKFARRLEGRFALPVFMVDERLTSRSARELLVDISERRKGKLPSLDSTAAVLMVEGWLAQPDCGLVP